MIPSPPKLDAVRNVKVVPPIGVTAAPENEASIEEEEEQEDSFEDDEGEIDEEIEVPAALFMWSMQQILTSFMHILKGRRWRRRRRSRGGICRIQWRLWW